MTKEIIFFSLGDSNKISTWSNVPYMFSKELEKKGYIIRRINILPNQKIRYRYNMIFQKIYNWIWPQNIYYYERSWLFYLITSLKIRNAVKKYNNAVICIFCTFAFFNKFNSIPSLLLCDWTYNILIRDRLNREPFYIEKKYIKRENRAINNAKFVISLFPDCAKKMKEDNPYANIHYMNNNVVNSVYNGIIDEEKILKNKQNSHKLLFIGNQNNPSYLKTAKIIAEAFQIVKESINDIELHIIGIESSILGSTNKNIHCYGYLNKDNKEECEMYYNIILQSSLIINTTPLWAGYSSIIEAMYYYTPVLVSPFKDFVKEFGQSIDFGKYCSGYAPNIIARDIESIIESSNYLQLARNAHLKTRNYTWENYVNKILSLINNSTVI